MAYTITELEDLTGLNRRTIHYYTQQGVIPPPEGKGGAARYGEEHLLRLKLIKPLQESHLRLAGIREALEEMSLKEMRTLLNLASSEESWDTDSLQAWVGEPLAQYWFEVPEDSEPPRGRRSRFLRICSGVPCRKRRHGSGRGWQKAWNSISAQTRTGGYGQPWSKCSARVKNCVTFYLNCKEIELWIKS
jgi:DNA-binding transcriptional MerR regulator